MKRIDLERMTRSALEAMPGDLQETALLRATGASVIVWHVATPDTLRRVYASSRALALVHIEGER